MGDITKIDREVYGTREVIVYGDPSLGHSLQAGFDDDVLVAMFQRTYMRTEWSDVTRKHEIIAHDATVYVFATSRDRHIELLTKEIQCLKEQLNEEKTKNKVFEEAAKRLGVPVE